MRTKLLNLAAFAALLAPHGAGAADLYRAPPPAPIVPVTTPVFTWTGCYVGVQVGYGATDVRSTYTTTIPAPPALAATGQYDIDAGFGGGHLGCNYQFGAVVVGLEGEINGADFGADANTVGLAAGPLPLDTFAFSTDINWFGSIAGRLGFAVDRALFYAVGGYAFADIEHRFTVTSPGPVVRTFGSNDDTTSGWTIGAGIEYAFAPNFTARVEYRHYTFEGDTIADLTAAGLALGAFADADDLDIDTVRIGLSYKF